MKIKNYLTMILIVGGLLAGSAAGLWLSGNKKVFSVSGEPLRNLSKAAIGAEPPQIKGNGSAEVTLEEFGDFQCPPCARLHAEVKKLEQEYGSRIQIVYRHYPLASHKQAMNAAEAAEAAAQQGKFWEMYDLLFERQEDWSEKSNARELFINYARMLKLDVEKFTRDLDSPQIRERIEADKKRADSIDISGTPSLFINGQEVSPEAMNPQAIRDEINAALKK
jgi:protein-disulfide isomerase